MAATEPGESVAATDARAGPGNAHWRRHQLLKEHDMMVHPDIHAALARERSATLLAAASAYRRAVGHVRGGGVGIARYDGDREIPAGIAVTVVDERQG